MGRTENKSTADILNGDMTKSFLRDKTEVSLLLVSLFSIELKLVARASKQEKCKNHLYWKLRIKTVSVYQ